MEVQESFSTNSQLFFGYPSALTEYTLFYFQPEQKPDENRIISIYRTRVDDCGRLWFVCTGALEQSNALNFTKLEEIYIFYCFRRNGSSATSISLGD